MPKRRVLVTGGAGRIGTMFRDSIGNEWDLVCFDRKPAAGAPGAVVADLTDLPALERAAAGCDAVVHLGAHPNPHRDYAGIIVPSNVVGTWNVLEAAARAGVRRVVFASTVQTEFGHPEDVRVSVDMPAAPRNNYAASKVFGEHLGFLYSRDRGLSVVCIRFGAVVVSMRRAEMIASGEATQEITLTERDCCRFLRRAVEAERVRYAVV
ncbi:MAG: NAD(P)-dependent oxidoreductase, partial [bacterium]